MLKPIYKTTTVTYYRLAFPGMTWELTFSDFDLAKEKYLELSKIGEGVEIQHFVINADGEKNTYQVNPDDGKYLRMIE